MNPCTARSNARPRLGLRMSSFVVFATAASGSWMSILIVDSATWLFRYRIWPVIWSIFSCTWSSWFWIARLWPIEEVCAISPYSTLRRDV